MEQQTEQRLSILDDQLLEEIALLSRVMVEATCVCGPLDQAALDQILFLGDR